MRTRNEQQAMLTQISTTSTSTTTTYMAAHLSVDNDCVLALNEFWIAAARAVEDDVWRHRHIVLLQHLVNFAPVKEAVLHGKLVEEKRFAKRHVLLHFGEVVPRGVECNQAIARRPRPHVLLKQALFENKNLKLFEAGNVSQNGLHWGRHDLLLHDNNHEGDHATLLKRPRVLDKRQLRHILDLLDVIRWQLLVLVWRLLVMMVVVLVVMVVVVMLLMLLQKVELVLLFVVKQLVLLRCCAPLQLCILLLPLLRRLVAARARVCLL